MNNIQTEKKALIKLQIILENKVNTRINKKYETRNKKEKIINT